MKSNQSKAGQIILITGAGGYIGSITTQLALENGYQVVAVDNFSRGYQDPLVYLQDKFGQDQLLWHKIDLVKDALDPLFDQHKFTAIIHFAGLANVGESWDHPELYFDNNVVGSQNLAKTASKHGVSKVVFSSSCAVYGDAKYLPIDENHPLAIPSSPYGASKKICEEILGWYSKTGKLDYVFLRYFNVTGASDDAQLGDSKKPSFHLVQNALRGALGLGQFELNYAPVKTPDGSPVRDYVNVVDLAQAHMLALKFLINNSGKSEVFNLGTGSGNSVLEIVQLVKQKTGKDFSVQVASQRRKGEADKMIADIAKAKKILGWQPTHSLEQSIDSLIAWYNSHPQGWSK